MASPFPESGSQASHPQFGGLLYQKTPSYGLLGAGVLLGLGGIVFGCMVLCGVIRGEASGWVGTIFIILGLCFAIGCSIPMKTRYSFYERGVTYVSFFGSESMSYDEVESFGFALTKHYTNLVYTGTTFTFSLASHGDLGRKKSIFLDSSFDNDEFSGLLEDLRDHISETIASRMADRLSAGEKVDWGSNLAFTPDGFEYRPQGFLGRKAPVPVPYEMLRAYDIDKGVLTANHSAFENASGERVKEGAFTVQVGEQNFWPGFFLFLAMLEDPDADPDTDDTQ